MPLLDRRLLVSLALVAAVLAVYGPSLRFDFVLSDDLMYVTDNDAVLAGLTPQGARWALTTNEASNWHPLTWLSLMLDAELHGADAGGFRATNLALHALAVLLFFGFLCAATGRVLPGALAAALLAVHPIHVESVAWVSQRKDLLCGVFGFAALWAYVAYARRGGAARYLGVALLFAAGLASKPALVTWPAVMGLLDLWPLRRWQRLPGGPVPGVAAPAAPARALGWLLAEKLPLFALSAAVCLITLRVQAPAMSGGAIELTLPDRLVNAALAYVRYLGKLVWPASFGVFYPHPALPGGDPIGAPGVAALLALLGALCAFAWWRRERAPWLGVGWLWFLGVLVPMLGLVQVGEQAMADRYAYLSFAGLYLALAWSADAIARRWLPQGTLRRDAAVAVGVALWVALGVRAALQAQVWRDARSLFAHALAVAPRAPFTLSGLATVHIRAGELDAAIPLLERALAQQPDYVPALNNLAVALLTRGQTAEAIVLLERVVAITPGRPDRHVQLAKLLHAAGRRQEAERHYREAIARAPTRPAAADGPEAQRLLAGLLAADGRRAEAAELRAAAEAWYRAKLATSDFGAWRAHLGLGELALDRRDRAAARSHLEAALAGDRVGMSHEHIRTLLAALDGEASR